MVEVCTASASSGSFGGTLTLTLRGEVRGSPWDPRMHCQQQRQLVRLTLQDCVHMFLRVAMNGYGAGAVET
jgi:hypothetical protein